MFASATVLVQPGCVRRVGRWLLEAPVAAFARAKQSEELRLLGALEGDLEVSALAPLLLELQLEALDA